MLPLSLNGFNSLPPQGVQRETAWMATAIAARDRRIDLARVEAFDLGTAEVFPALLEIRRGRKAERVEPRVMQMLVALHGAAGAPVSRDALVELCWDGLSISDDAITQCVSKLRRALADVPNVQVLSVPRVGYRIAAEAAATRAPAITKQQGINRRAVVAGVAGVMAAGLGGRFLFRPQVGATPDRIAVLPFANLTGDPRQAYFSDGIAEEIRNSMAGLDGLKVIGRTSSEAVRSIDAATAASRLNASSLLIGSVRRSPSRIRVAAQLIDGRTGIQRWLHTYDLAPGDSLQLQTDIAESVALALSMKLGRADRRAMMVGGTRNSTAFDLYLQAKYALKLSDTEPAIRQAIALSDAAIGLDQNYAKAYAIKAFALIGLSSSFQPDARSLVEGYVQADAAARKALSIAPNLTIAYAALAASMSGRQNLRGAFDQYRRAEGLPTSDPGVMKHFVYSLAETGRTRQALSRAERLIALDPLNAGLVGSQAFSFFFARNFTKAINLASRALQIAPVMTQQQSLIGDCLTLLGRYDEALTHYAQVPATDVYRLTGEAIVAARTDNRKASDRILNRLELAYEPATYQRGQIHAQRGEFDQAFAELARAQLILDPGLDALPADPFVDPLRADPRFNRLTKTMDFG